MNRSALVSGWLLVWCIALSGLGGCGSDSDPDSGGAAGAGAGATATGGVAGAGAAATGGVAGAGAAATGGGAAGATGGATSGGTSSGGTSSGGVAGNPGAAGSSGSSGAAGASGYAGAAGSSGSSGAGGGNQAGASAFVTVADGRFVREGIEYRALSQSLYPFHRESNEVISDKIATAQAAGHDQVRIVVPFLNLRYAICSNSTSGVRDCADNHDPTPFTDKAYLGEDIWTRIDWVIKEAGDRGMTVFLETSDLFTVFYAMQWLALAGYLPGETEVDYDPFDLTVSGALWDEYVDFVTQRVNTYTGTVYREDPTIFSYSILPEHLPFGGSSSRTPGGCGGNPECACTEDIIALVEHLAARFKANDSSHLVGADGFLHLTGAHSGGDPRGCTNQLDSDYFLDIWSNPNIDYGGIHLYPPASSYGGWPAGEWANLDTYAQALGNLGKPLVVETGVDYANSTQTDSVTYLQNIFAAASAEQVPVILFWNWNANASGSYDLYPGLTPVQDALIAVIQAHAADY